MKKIILLLLITHYSLFVFSQTDPVEKDSCANTAFWQVQTRVASVQSASQLLSDTSVHDVNVLKYAQLMTAQPQGGWVVAMSYGVLNDPDVSCASDIYTIQYRVNLIYTQQAYAYYQVLPPQASVSESIARILNKNLRKNIKNGR